MEQMLIPININREADYDDFERGGRKSLRSHRSVWK